MARKKEIIAKKRADATELEGRLGNAEIVLHASKERAAATNSSTQDSATQVINMYKESEDVMQEVTEGSMEAYQLGFSNCRERVA